MHVLLNSLRFAVDMSAHKCIETNYFFNNLTVNEHNIMDISGKRSINFDFHVVLHIWVYKKSRKLLFALELAAQVARSLSAVWKHEEEMRILPLTLQANPNCNLVGCRIFLSIRLMEDAVEKWD